MMEMMGNACSNLEEHGLYLLRGIKTYLDGKSLASYLVPFLTGERTALTRRSRRRT